MYDLKQTIPSKLYHPVRDLRSQDTLSTKRLLVLFLFYKDTFITDDFFIILATFLEQLICLC